ncbi:hypothetical protein EON63_19130 [archaeon]|nr:MAG: hypothetical protein EON63_19130 [archaeon]
MPHSILIHSYHTYTIHIHHTHTFFLAQLVQQTAYLVDVDSALPFHIKAIKYRTNDTVPWTKCMEID